jgi:hypothetical protein
MKALFSWHVNSKTTHTLWRVLTHITGEQPLHENFQVLDGVRSPKRTHLVYDFNHMDTAIDAPLERSIQNVILNAHDISEK